MTKSIRDREWTCVLQLWLDPLWRSISTKLFCNNSYRFAVYTKEIAKYIRVHAIDACKDRPRSTFGARDAFKLWNRCRKTNMLSVASTSRLRSTRDLFRTLLPSPETAGEAHPSPLPTLHAYISTLSLGARTFRPKLMSRFRAFGRGGLSNRCGGARTALYLEAGELVERSSLARCTARKLRLTTGLGAASWRQGMHATKSGAAQPLQMVEPLYENLQCPLRPINKVLGR